MKKLSILLVAFVLSFGLIACGETTTDAATTDPAVETTVSTEDDTTTTALNEFPVFSGIQSERTVSVGDTFNPLEGVTATDPEDGVLPESSITVEGLDCLHLDSSNVIGEAAGGATCTLTYKAEDSQGAKAQQNSVVTVEVVVDPSTNMVVNGDFSLAENGWANADGSGLLDLHNGGAGTASVTNEELVVNITMGSWDGGSSPRVNQEGLNFVNGQTYEVSIDAKADVAGFIMKSQVGVLLSASPWFTPYYYNPEGAFEFVLGTEFQTFTYKFTVTEATTDNGTLTIELGTHGDDTAYTVTLDNIVIKESTPDADEDAPVVSGLDDVTITTEDTFDALAGVSVSDADVTVDVTDIVVSHDGGANVTEESGVYSFLAEGVYTFTYTVSDSSMNEATPTRTVNVVGDAETPVISGLEPSYVVNGFAWNPLLGITYSDNIDDSLTDDDFVIVVKDSTDAVVPADANGLYTFTTNGVYTVLYTLLDASGNAANEVKTISVVDEPTGMVNLIEEPDFDTSTTWATWIADYDGVAATFDTTSGAMVVDITNMAGEWYSVQVNNSTVDLVAGTTYIIVFEASSSAARDIIIEMIDGNNQWTVKLDTSTQRFALEYTAAADVTDAKLNFLMGNFGGGTNGQITLDNVVVYEKAANGANVLEEGDFATSATWNNYIHADGVTAATVDMTSGALVVDVTNVGAEFWSVQVYSNTADLVAGTWYTITVDASSTVARQIYLEIVDGNNQFVMDLTDSTQTFTFEVFWTADTTDAKVNLIMGNINGALPSVITIDNITITPVPAN